MDEDYVLGKITRLLEQGCTMLATHHSCGAPLFRCKGEVVCPVCSFPEGQAGRDLSKATVSSLEPSSEREAVEQEAVPGSRQDAMPGAMPGSRQEAGQDASSPASREENPAYERREAKQSPSMPGPDQASFRLGLQSPSTLGQCGRSQVEAELKEALLLRLRELASQIVEERDLSRLERQLACAHEAVRVLRLLS
jgi:UPF0148 protein